MNNRKLVTIPTATIRTDFESFLANDDNERIIFSSKFGTGKTYFLNEFFKDREEYEVFHLFPVNYQISSNEEIIELLKYDILLKIIEKDPQAFKNDEEKVKLLSTALYFKSHGNGILKFFVSLVPKVGHHINNFIDLVEKIESEVNEEKIISNFIEKAKPIKEGDIVSFLIQENIKKTEIESQNPKKKVLILDDLDRIDPNHIFRILNVFGSHFGEEKNGISEKENKLGFDHIILVCDENNIKNIFHHFYGEKADYQGYINKFYSRRIFEFDNKKEVKKALETIMMNNGISSVSSNEAVKKKTEEQFKDKENYLFYFLNEVFFYLIDSNRINLRDLFQITKSHKIGDDSSDGIHFYLALFISVLFALFSKEKAIEILKELRDGVSIANQHNYCQILVQMEVDIDNDGNNLFEMKEREDETIWSFSFGDLSLETDGEGSHEIKEKGIKLEGRRKEYRAAQKLFYHYLVRWIEEYSNQ